MIDKTNTPADPTKIFLALAIIIPLALGAYMMYADRSLLSLVGSLVLLSLSFLMLVGAVFTPFAPITHFVHKYWVALGDLMGHLNNGLILSVVFFGIFVPIALYRRLRRRDAMGFRKPRTSAESYFVVSNKLDTNHYKDPF